MGIAYVNERAAKTVVEIEEKFRRLHPSVGVIFISVSAVPVEGGESSEFIIRLGLQRKLSVGAGEAIIQSTLRKELSAGMKVLSAIYLGVSGAFCDDKGDERAHQAPA